MQSLIACLKTRLVRRHKQQVFERLVAVWKLPNIESHSQLKTYLKQVVWKNHVKNRLLQCMVKDTRQQLYFRRWQNHATVKSQRKVTVTDNALRFYEMLSAV